jgi:DNA-directed RNA polymerase subunit RPC12/RpoP
MEQVSYDSVKKTYICNQCQARVHPAATSIKKSAPAAEVSKPSIFGGKKAPKDEIIKYACLKCKYKFERRKDKPATKCPYCGESKLEEVSNQAAKILADSDKFGF